MPRSAHFWTMEKVAFLLFAVLICYLFWQVISPFALVLLTSGIAAIIFAPVHGWLTAKIKYRKVAAFLVALGVFFLVVTPLFLATILMVKQASELVDMSIHNVSVFTEFNLDQEFPIVGVLPDVVKNAIRSLDIAAIAQSAGSWVVANIGALFSSAMKLVINTVIFFVGLYYFLADRERIHKELLSLSPMRDSVDENITKRIVGTVRSVVFGAVVLAIVQGFMAFIGMTIFGVPGAALWGAAAVVASQVPVFGTSAVMAPAIIYLFITGQTGPAIGLLLWSAIVVSFVDNLLGPFLVKGSTHMHTLLVLVSILGGVTVFGPIGFIVGPVLLAAFLVIVELYKAGFLQLR